MELRQVLGFGLRFVLVKDLLQTDLQQDGGGRASRVIDDLGVGTSIGCLTCRWLLPLQESQCC